MGRALGWWLLGVAAFVLGGEALCRLLPVSGSTLTGYYFDPNILSYPPGHEWTVSTSWDLRNAQRLRSNNFGFVSVHDFVRNERAVALVGDSFVESSMLAAADRPAAQLEAALQSSRPVYALGGPGSALLDYAERIRFVHERFGVRDFVVLMERGDVMQSLCGSGNVHAPCLDRKTLEPRVERLPPPGLAKRILRESALAQYVFGQLKVAPDRLWQQAIAQSRPVSVEPVATRPVRERPADADTNASMPMPEVDAVARVFFERVKAHVGGRLVIIVDSDRVHIRQRAKRVDPARDRFMALARQAGAVVIDTEPLFVAHYARSPLRLEVGPYDTHLNPVGVGIVMRAAAGALRDAPTDKVQQDVR